MSVFTLAISYLTTSKLPWFMYLTFQVPMQYCSLQHWTLLSPPDTSTPGHHFLFGPVSSFFLLLFLCLSPVAYCTPSDLGGLYSVVISFCLFILFMGFFRQEYWSALPFPLQWTTFCQNSPPWPVLDVALHSMVHSFLELHKAVILVIIWLAFCDCGFHTQHGWNLKTFSYVKEQSPKDIEHMIRLCSIL